MKKLLIILLSASLISGGKVKDNTEYLKNEIYKMVKASRTGYHKRKAEKIYKYAKKYGIDELFYARLIGVESSFDHNAYHNSGCVGLGAISIKNWSHLLYRIDDGKLGKHIFDKNILDTDRYFYRIGYNLEMSAIIISSRIRLYKGDYRKALTFYGGWTRKWRKRNPDGYKRYINTIMGCEL